MENEISLNDIRSDVFTSLEHNLKERDFDILYEYKDVIHAAMLKAVSKALELASENAEMEFIPFNDNERNFNGVTINEESITNVIKLFK